MGDQRIRRKGVVKKESILIKRIGAWSTECTESWKNERRVSLVSSPNVVLDLLANQCKGMYSWFAATPPTMTGAARTMVHQSRQSARKGQVLAINLTPKQPAL